MSDAECLPLSSASSRIPYNPRITSFFHIDDTAFVHMVRFAVAACAVGRASIAARNRTMQAQFRVSQVLDVCNVSLFISPSFLLFVLDDSTAAGLQAAIAAYTTPAMWRRIPVPTPAMFPSAVVAPLVDGKRFLTPSPISSASGPFEREASDSVSIASGPIDSAWAKVTHVFTLRHVPFPDCVCTLPMLNRHITTTHTHVIRLNPRPTTTWIMRLFCTISSKVSIMMSRHRQLCLRLTVKK